MCVRCHGEQSIVANAVTSAHELNCKETELVCEQDQRLLLPLLPLPLLLPRCAAESGASYVRVSELQSLECKAGVGVFSAVAWLFMPMRVAVAVAAAASASVAAWTKL